MQTRLHQGQASHATHLQFELRHIAAVDAVVTAVVGSWCNFVHHQGAQGIPLGTVLQQEKLHAQHAHIVQATRHFIGGVQSLLLGLGGQGVFKHLGHRQNAVAVQVHLQGQMHHLAVMPSCQHHRAFSGEGQAFFQDADRRALGLKLRPSRRQVGQ